MSQTEPTSFILDGWTVIPKQHQLSRDGKSIRLEPKVMEVLVYFASRQGEVISRDELEQDVWRGAIVGYDALTATIGKLRKALQDNSKKPRIIVTVPKRGYQLVAPVKQISQLAATNDVEVQHNATDIPTQTPVKSIKRFGFAAVLVILSAAVVMAWLKDTPTTQTNSSTLLVLPIENLNKDKAHDVFVDGVTEDLITDLSRFSDLQVLASNTSFQYKGLTPTNRELHDELKIDYILKGNVRRNKDTMRINLQLIDAKQGVNLWAQRFDRYTEEIFSVQDEIIKNIIASLKINQTNNKITVQTKRATNNLRAYELFLEGQRFSRGQSRQSNQQARELYKQAIQVDDAYGRAYGALAYTLALDYRHGWTDTPVENLDRALQLAKRGIELNANIPQTHWSLGYVYLRRNENEKALAAAKKSIEVAPNYADGYGLLGLISNGLAQFDQALKYITKGKQLNPYYTWDYLFNEGFALYMKCQHKEAITVLEQAEQRNDNALPMKLGLAASYVRNNQLEDAQWKVEQIRTLNPETTIEHLSKTFIMQVQPYKDLYLNDLRKAGLPE